MRTTIAEHEYHLSPAYRRPRIEPSITPGCEDWYDVVLADDGYGEHRAPISPTEAQELLAMPGCTLRDCRTYHRVYRDGVLLGLAPPGDDYPIDQIVLP